MANKSNDEMVMVDAVEDFGGPASSGRHLLHGLTDAEVGTEQASDDTTLSADIVRRSVAHPLDEA